MLTENTHSRQKPCNIALYDKHFLIHEIMTTLLNEKPNMCW